MQLLPGRFDVYPVSEELQPGSLSRWERLPVRPLLGVAVLLALAIGAFAYLRQRQTTASPAPHDTAAAASSPLPIKVLSNDAADHAMRAQRAVSTVIHSLRDIENTMDTARSDRNFSPSEMERVEEKIRAARRKLEDSLADMKTVGALVEK